MFPISGKTGMLKDCSKMAAQSDAHVMIIKYWLKVKQLQMHIFSLAFFFYMSNCFEVQHQSILCEDSTGTLITGTHNANMVLTSRKQMMGMKSQ